MLIAHFDFLGSVSTGTLRTPDLLDRFAGTLRDRVREAAPHLGALNPDHLALADEADALLESDPDEWSDEDTERAGYILSDLFDALSDYAPDFAYFGAHVGDGADFGYWIDWESIDADTLGLDPEVIRIAAGDPHPADAPYILEVSDHGNATLYGAPDDTGSRPCLWSVV